MQTYPLFIATAPTLLPYLQKELLSFGFSDILQTNTGIKLNGTFKDIMFLNLHLRCAHHIYLLLKEFECNNPEELYKNTYTISWENFIASDGYVSVASNVTNPTIRDSRFANLKCKDAIVDRLQKVNGKRPDSGSDRNKTVVYLYWKKDYCAIYFDTSGETLSRRGYRKIPLQAPLQETLAAGLIFASTWVGQTNFINPMCGSATLAIEAALIALNRAPSITRDNFGFMHIKGYNPGSWQEIKQKTLNQEKALQCKIIATDNRQKAIDAAYKNALLAGVEKYIDFKVCDYSQTHIPKGSGIVIINPGYGVRMGELSKLKDTYKEIGDFFKQKCAGYTGYIFSGNIELLKNVGLRPKRRMIFYNGDIECRLCEYPLYEGSLPR